MSVECTGLLSFQLTPHALCNTSHRSDHHDWSKTRQLSSGREEEKVFKLLLVESTLSLYASSFLVLKLKDGFLS